VAAGISGATPEVFGRIVMSEQQFNEATVSEATNGVVVAEETAQAEPETPAEATVPAEVAAPVAAAPATADEAAPEVEAPSASATGAAPETTDTPEAVAAPEAAAPEAVTSDTAESAGESGAVDANGTVVRMLSVGQQVKGKVKRVTEFGAFVDIGVGRDGLVHISELSAKRVGKVSDVLQEGQEVLLWIKKLDRDRNRISLTMIEPGKRTIRDLQKGEVVEGTVTRILPYGAFIDIGIGRDALLHVREMGEGFIAKPEDVVQVGQLVEVRVIEIARRRSRVDLSMKGLRPEPEAPQQSSQSNSQPQPEPEPELVDEYADLEVLSPMQLAFKRAQEKSGVVLPPTGKPGKTNKRQDSNNKRAQQEDIIARTLSTGKK
jgi:predicted RNA-binding protein with RPS1 domain